MQKRINLVREYFLLDMNTVIRFMIISDLVWGSAAGLLGPIFAIFILEFIDGGSAAVAGAAAAIYLITKSILQIPAASFIDRIRGEKDDFWVMFIFSLVGALLPISYLFINTPAELFFVQFLLGACIAFTFPSYMAIFTRHIDKHREGTEWGVYFTMIDLGSAITASLGGILAEIIGFHNLIVVVVCFSIVGVLFLFPLRQEIAIVKPVRRRKRK